MVRNIVVDMVCEWNSYTGEEGFFDEFLESAIDALLVASRQVEELDFLYKQAKRNAELLEG